MSRYDFSTLSSQDFEELSRDLLQAEWNVWLEAFKSGRDKGIDLRHIRADGGAMIIQCKHFLRSGFAKLLNHLRKDELPKIELLKPSRYVVVTSVSLTSGNKDAIVQALNPFVITPNDVIGAEDIDGLLSRHSSVERKNFKLWLTSTEVIERVLHNAEICQTEFEVQRIWKNLPLFVQSAVFPQAMKMLSDRRIAVISGPPGIGKTTLAEMLLYTYLEQGYEPVVIKAEISEGKTFFRNEKKRIFYYDDFLGQIYLGDHTEYLGRNQDAALTDFMEMVRRSEHSRFILTTRPHILSSALRLSERLARSALAEQRCVLELSSYTFGNRARILYNHLYFSELPQAYKKAVLEEDFFLEITKHEHFNPRLIEWLSTELRQREVPVQGYRTYIRRLLASPHDIWRGAFNNQLSDAARDVLLGFYTLGEWINVGDMEPAFRSLHRFRTKKYNRSAGPGEFRDALRELDGAFLRYGSGDASYLNPSIREFIAALITEDADTAEDLLHAAIRFRQVAALKELADQHPDSPIAKLFAASTAILPQMLRALLQAPAIRWEKSRIGMRGHPIDMGTEARIGFMAELSEAFKSLPMLELVTQASEQLIIGWNGVVPEFTTVLHLLEKLRKLPWVLAHGGHALYRRLLDETLGHLTFATAADWLALSDLPKRSMGWSVENQAALDQAFQEYCDEGFNEERSNTGDSDEMGALLSSLTELATKRNHNFSQEIRQLQEDISEAEEEEHSESLSSGDSFPSDAAAMAHDSTTDDDVRQMFKTLCGE